MNVNLKNTRTELGHRNTQMATLSAISVTDAACCKKFTILLYKVSNINTIFKNKSRNNRLLIKYLLDKPCNNIKLIKFTQKQKQFSHKIPKESHKRNVSVCRNHQHIMSNILRTK